MRWKLAAVCGDCRTDRSDWGYPSGCGIVSKLRTKSRSIRAIHEEKVRKETKDREETDKEKAAGEKNVNEVRQERKRLEWELTRIQRQWKEKEIRRGNLQEQIDEFDPGEVQKALEKQCGRLIWRKNI